MNIYKLYRALNLRLTIGQLLQRKLKQESSSNNFLFSAEYRLEGPLLRSTSDLVHCA